MHVEWVHEKWGKNDAMSFNTVTKGCLCNQKIWAEFPNQNTCLKINKWGRKKENEQRMGWGEVIGTREWEEGKLRGSWTGHLKSLASAAACHDANLAHSSCLVHLLWEQKISGLYVEHLLNLLTLGNLQSISKVSRRHEPTGKCGNLAWNGSPCSRIGF